MRPDKAFNIAADSFGDYLKELGNAAGVDIKDFDGLTAAFEQRFEFFASLGGRLSDHGLNSFHFVKVPEAELNQILVKGQNNEELTAHDIDAYATGLIEVLMRLNKKFDWTMQYHMNATRNANKPMFKKIGADAGFDSMGTQPDIAAQIMELLTDMQNEDNIPRTMLYSLNPNDWMQLATGMGDFYGGGVTQKNATGMCLVV